ncbi:hypothetical protein Tco_1288751 [Tanacetum coccineum]
MDGISINDLTIEQYLMMTQGGQVPTVVNQSELENMTIAEYVEYEEKLKRHHLGNPRSFSPTKYNYLNQDNPYKKFLHYSYNVKTKTYYDLPLLLPCYKPIQSLTKHTELGKENSYMAYTKDTAFDDVLSSDTQKEDDIPTKVMPYLGASVNIMPKLMFEELKLAEIKKTNMLVEITDMTKRTPLGRVENILVKVDKFLFSSNFAIIYMVAKGNETVILKRPFLAAIHAKIDVFAREITIGTRVKG